MDVDQLNVIDTIKNGFMQLLHSLYPDLALGVDNDTLRYGLIPFVALAVGILAVTLLFKLFPKWRRFTFVLGTLAVLVFLVEGVMFPNRLQYVSCGLERWVDQVSSAAPSPTPNPTDPPSGKSTAPPAATATPAPTSGVIVSRVTDAPQESAAAGENLLPGYVQEKKSVNGFIQIKTREVLSGYVGRKITLSLEIKPDRDALVSIYAYQNSGVSIADEKRVNLKAGTFTPVTLTTTVKDYGQIQNYTTGGIAFYNSSRIEFTIRRVKIELGDRATAFSVAPGDPILGRNLLAGYAQEHSTVNGLLLVPVQEALAQYVGLTVNISFDIKCSDVRDISVVAYREQGVSLDLRNADPRTVRTSMGMYTRYSFSTTVREFTASGDGSIAFIDHAPLKKGFSIQHLKIELGAESTGWSAAPGDAG